MRALKKIHIPNKLRVLYLLFPNESHVKKLTVNGLPTHVFSKTFCKKLEFFCETSISLLNLNVYEQRGEKTLRTLKFL